MTHTFKVGDKGKTRDGYDYEVIYDDGIRLVAFLNGFEDAKTYSDPQGRYEPVYAHPFDLLPPKATRTFWVPLLRAADGHSFVACLYDDREAAFDTTYEIIAIKEFTITEGEGMDE